MVWALAFQRKLEVQAPIRAESAWVARSSPGSKIRNFDRRTVVARKGSFDSQGRAPSNITPTFSSDSSLILQALSRLALVHEP